ILINGPRESNVLSVGRKPEGGGMPEGGPGVSGGASKSYSVWFSPTRASDFDLLFSSPNSWNLSRKMVSVFKFFPKDVSRMFSLGAFSKLKNWGIDLALNSEAIVEWSCNGTLNAIDTVNLLDSLMSKGVKVKYIEMDMPLYKGRTYCKQGLNESAIQVAAYISKIKSLYPGIIIGDLEPYPFFSVQELKDWKDELSRNVVSLGFLHILIDMGKVERDGVHNSLSFKFGQKETVFNWTTDRCAQDDVPDTPARAFVDVNGRVQLLASHYDTRRAIGTNLSSVRHECNVLFSSHRDYTASNYDYLEWLISPYTLDGQKVFSFVHNEYYGSPGQCTLGQLKCWWNSITAAVSNDAGLTYSHPVQAPGHLIATPPYRYIPNFGKAVGYMMPSNIVKKGDYYYSLFQAESIYLQNRSMCLMRSDNVSDFRSWKIWNGTTFKKFIDPYRTTNFNPKDYLCKNVFWRNPSYSEDIGMLATSVVWSTYLGKFIAIGEGAAYDASLGRTVYGIFYKLSDDLIHWTPRKLLREAPLKWANPFRDPIETYFSFLDDKVPLKIGNVEIPGVRNFELVTQNPYLYYTLSWFKNSPRFWERHLLRQRVHFIKPKGLLKDDLSQINNYYSSSGIDLGVVVTAGHYSAKSAPEYYSDALVYLNNLSSSLGFLRHLVFDDSVNNVILPATPELGGYTQTSLILDGLDRSFLGPTVFNIFPKNVSPGNSVTIYGVGFDSSTGVRIDGSDYWNFKVLSPNEIRVNIPSSIALGYHSLSVTNGTGESFSSGFFVNGGGNGNVVITSISPNIILNSTTTDVILRGTGFDTISLNYIGVNLTSNKGSIFITDSTNPGFIRKGINPGELVLKFVKGGYPVGDYSLQLVVLGSGGFYASNK
ncbi:MAG: hypothetical protein D6734_03145, partial [Candidatus Schekmanbacteria bacterium]